MKICSNCGTHLDDTAVVCTTCGTPASVNDTAPTAVNVAPQPGVSPTDAPCRGFWWLGFFFWYVGLVLFIVFKNKSPQRAKSALKGMITGLIVSAAIAIIYVIIYVLFFVAAMGISMY